MAGVEEEGAFRIAQLAGLEQAGQLLPGVTVEDPARRLHPLRPVRKHLAGFFEGNVFRFELAPGAADERRGPVNGSGWQCGTGLMAHRRPDGEHTHDGKNHSQDKRKSVKYMWVAWSLPERLFYNFTTLSNTVQLSAIFRHLLDSAS